MVSFSTQANVVNIAFGDYSGGIVGQESEEEVVRDGIAAIHSKVWTSLSSNSSSISEFVKHKFASFD